MSAPEPTPPLPNSKRKDNNKNKTGGKKRGKKTERKNHPEKFFEKLGDTSDITAIKDDIPDVFETEGHGHTRTHTHIAHAHPELKAQPKS
eukprot:1350315-Amorphochlora_amoeboformis.AAC.1